ncbi:hypothetical protein FKP32DRAFT_1670711, partial [Trametes sanguinea]
VSAEGKPSPTSSDTARSSSPTVNGETTASLSTDVIDIAPSSSNADTDGAHKGDVAVNANVDAGAQQRHIDANANVDGTTDPAQHDTQLLAEIRKPSWMTDDTVSRIRDFLNFAEERTNRYA